MWDRLSCSCSRQKPPPSIVVHAFNMFSTEFMFSLTESLFTAGARTPRVIPLICPTTRDYGYSRAIASKASQYLPHLNLLYPNPPAQKQNKERQKLEKKGSWSVLYTCPLSFLSRNLLFHPAGLLRWLPSRSQLCNSGSKGSSRMAVSLPPLFRVGGGNSSSSISMDWPETGSSRHVCP